MKSVPKLISYPHDCFWNFSQFLAIYFVLFLSGSKFNSKIADMRGPHVCAPSPRGCHAPAPCHKGASWQRHSDSLSPMSEPRRRLASRTPVPTAPSLVSEVDHIAVRARHRRCLAASAVANSSKLSGALSPPPLLPLFSVDC
jgi:hypothetical protein